MKTNANYGTMTDISKIQLLIIFFVSSAFQTKYLQTNTQVVSHIFYYCSHSSHLIFILHPTFSFSLYLIIIRLLLLIFKLFSVITFFERKILMTIVTSLNILSCVARVEIDNHVLQSLFWYFVHVIFFFRIILWRRGFFSQNGGNYFRFSAFKL